MRESHSFIPSRKDLPRDETSTNAKLLLRAGYIEKLMAGVYTFLPLGLLTLRNIEAIIRDEMNRLGASELLMPALHPKAVWDETQRWSKLAPIMYQFKDHGERELGLGPTHEEIITEFIRRHVHSYRDLPLALYQLQTKFRDEPRAKSGLIRLREFVMKDLYSFHANEQDLEDFYERVRASYLKIFERCGLTALCIEASGGDFTDQYSHEFNVLTDAGEDHVLYCPSCAFARNAEIATLKAGEACPNGDGTLLEAKGVEVGNIFKLGTRFSEQMGARFVDENGQSRPLIMASYGIGPARVLGTIVEVHHDERGIVWPVSVSPMLASIIALSETAQRRAVVLEGACQKADLPVLFADRSGSAGAKFATADLLGFPVRIVISEKTGQRVEWKPRTGAPELISDTEALNRLRQLRRNHYAG